MLDLFDFSSGYYDDVPNLGPAIVAKVLPELCKPPASSDAIALTRAWAKMTWFTEDGKSFYFRDHSEHLLQILCAS